MNYEDEYLEAEQDLATEYYYTVTDLAESLDFILDNDYNR